MKWVLIGLSLWIISCKRDLHRRWFEATVIDTVNAWCTRASVTFLQRDSLQIISLTGQRSLRYRASISDQYRIIGTVLLVKITDPPTPSPDIPCLAIAPHYPAIWFSEVKKK